MKKKLLKVVDVTLSMFKYLLGISMMVSGVSTILSPVQVVGGVVAAIYGSHLILSLFGVYFFIAGAMLVYGKIRKHRRIVGWSLMMIYLAYLFATLLQYLAGLAWVVNLIMTVIVALLYLRWKYQKFYAAPKRVQPTS